MNTTKQLFTIGHSNLSIDDFIGLLQQHNITAVADVRSHPYSRYLPHFNKSPLQSTLSTLGIHYIFLGQELGARPTDLSCYVNGKALYDRIAATELFSQGIQRLLKEGETYKISLMCAEKDPITCHRTILVCRHLQKFNLEIYHILNDGALESHQQLEQRLLTLHGLDPAQLNQPKQLSLFDDMTSLNPVSKSSLEERLQEAYYRQGDKIAYQETKHESID
ncbi:MAG TPA: hypothetical protein DD379_27580 [Cyanobacteria bacterium UBA11162]|nr:hypothetical protein [Cyanobacteria bacterium UBA11162]